VVLADPLGFRPLVSYLPNTHITDFHHKFTNMPKAKYRIVQCPCCQKPFNDGRGISQHLQRTAECKDFVLSSQPRPVVDGGCFHTAGPFAPIEDTGDHSTKTVYPPDNTDVNFSPIVDDMPEPESDESLPDPTAMDDSNLQDVVSFPVAFTNSAYHEVQLLKLLHDIGAPNYAFQSFMEWGRNCNRDEYKFQPCPQRYEGQIRNLTELVGMEDCRPTTVPVYLEPDNLKLDVVVFPFATMLSSLLNCPILNKLENLVVNPSDRFGRYQSPDGRLDEVNSGQWYQDTYDQTIHDGDKDFLAPIIFTMDKTVISEASHLSVYVILFTTTVFNREVRLYCCFWVLLPLLPLM
jgi:hypothetical protein